MKFAGGTELKLHLDGDHGPGLGAIFVGEKGKIEINRNKIASNPKELVLAADNPGPNKRPETTYHIENWIECIKSRKRCNADIEIGQRATTLCYLVNIVREVGRVGEKLKWDPVAERFTNCERRTSSSAAAAQGLRTAGRGVTKAVPPSVVSHTDGNLCLGGTGVSPVLPTNTGETPVPPSLSEIPIIRHVNCETLH